MSAAVSQAVRPEDALYMQLDLLLWLEQELFGEVLIESMGTVWQNAVGSATLRNMPAIMHGNLQTATTYHISADMVTLIERAAARLVPEDRFSDMPSPTGFAVLDRPLTVTDVWGCDMLVHAVAWGRMKVVRIRDGADSERYRATGTVSRDALTHPGNEVQNATLFVGWNDVQRQPDHYSSQLLADLGARRYRETLGRWSVIGAELARDGAQVGPALISPALEHIRTGQETGRQAMPFTNSYRYLLAMFDLMGQTVTSTQRRRAAKTTQRRAARAGVQSGDVQVVTLRRRSMSDPDRERATRDVEWSRRWVVEGHWHRYRVGPDRQEVVRRWVDDYVKGPDDKPLIIPQKVFDLRR